MHAKIFTSDIYTISPYVIIVDALASAQVSAAEPAQKLKEMTRNYVDLVLQMPDEYLTIMLNRSPSILGHTSVLLKVHPKRDRPSALMKALTVCLSWGFSEWFGKFHDGLQANYGMAVEVALQI